MTKAEYIAELVNTLIKINRQSWTIHQLLSKKELIMDAEKQAGSDELETLEKTKAIMQSLNEVYGRL